MNTKAAFNLQYFDDGNKMNDDDIKRQSATNFFDGSIPHQATTNGLLPISQCFDGDENNRAGNSNV
mgnify:CR=1 FL=1